MSEQISREAFEQLEHDLQSLKQSVIGLQRLLIDIVEDIDFIREALDKIYRK